MNAEPIFHRDAERDLQGIIRHYQRKRQILVARHITAGIQRHARKQAVLPNTGQRFDEYMPGLRCTTVFHYLIFFKKTADTITVLRVIHGSRNVDRILKKYFG